MAKADPDQYIFVSGMMRSGTTLVQQALNAHPDINLQYQTLTDDFIKIKNKFLFEKNRKDYHALPHYNPVSGYTFNDFYNWQKTQPNIIEEIFKFMPKGRSEIAGVKEVLGEEFYPNLLDEGAFCLNVIRDPRDVITSMSFGNGEIYAGKPRPVLFDLRNWRKSIHFSFKLRKRPKFKTIIFEDLLRDPEKELQDVFSWLGVAPISSSEISLEIEKLAWQGNSSFGNKKPFDISAVGSYKTKLPVTVKDYIETVCAPELSWLGYCRKWCNINAEKVIESYKDPFPNNRKEIVDNYSSLKENRIYEANRLKKSIVNLNGEFFK